MQGKVLAGIFRPLFVMAVAAAYEIIEWRYAVIVGGMTRMIFSAGLWDAQKEHVSAIPAALSPLILFIWCAPGSRKGRGDR